MDNSRAIEPVSRHIKGESVECPCSDPCVKIQTLIHNMLEIYVSLREWYWCARLSDAAAACPKLATTNPEQLHELCTSLLCAILQLANSLQCTIASGMEELSEIIRAVKVLCDEHQAT